MPLDLKTPPHSAEIEQAAIGALLMDPDAIFKVDARLRAEDFYDPAHGQIYKAIQELREQGTPIDLLIVTNRLSDADLINAAGGSAYLAELTTSVLLQ